MVMQVAVDDGQKTKARLNGTNTDRCCLATSGMVAWAAIDEERLTQAFKSARRFLELDRGMAGSTEDTLKILRTATASRVSKSEVR
jgi:hypothetical protein